MKTICTLLLLGTLGFSQTAITNVSVIPMDRNTVLKNQTVVIEGDKITALGPSKSTKPPKGAKLINGRGKFLIPGLVDAHVHLLSPDEFPLYIANGVTTVFNLDGRPAHLDWRREIAEGKLFGPTIFTAGPIFFGSRTVETGVKAVNQQADAGYDAFKVFNQVSAEVYPAVVAEVKKRNLLLIGHIPRAVGAETAFASGQSVAHADEFLYTYFNSNRDEVPQNIRTDEIKLKELAGKVRLAGVIVEPTLVTYRDGIEEASNLDAYLKKPELKYLAPWVLDTISPANNRFKRQFKPADIPQIRDFYVFQQKMVRALHDSGVLLLAGTDATDSGPVAGFAIHDELEEMVKCGLSPYEALKTATVNPATYLRSADKFGTIQLGKRADLLLLNANPLEKIGNTRQIAGVMLHGRWIGAEQAQSMLDRLPTTYVREKGELVRNLDQNPSKAEEWVKANDPFRGMANFVFSELLTERGGTGFKSLLLSIREQDPQSGFIAEAALNQFGYQILTTGKMPEALTIFELNTEFYPKSPNTFDSLGEAQFKAGDLTKAVASYQRALELDANYANAEFAKKFVEERAGQ
jgi:Amidohydrolase family